MTVTSHTTDRQALLEAFRHAGQELATVYLPSRSAVEDAADRLGIRQRNVGSELSDLGASSRLIDLVDRTLADYEHDEGAGLILVATPEEILVRQPTFRPIGHTAVHVGATPELLPALAATQNDQPHLAVLLDRVGADVWSRTDLGEAIGFQSVSGDELHVHRGHPGGWSQRRFQQRAENTWEANAKHVVDEVLGGGNDQPAVVAVGGDVRAVGFFLEHVPDGIEILEVDGSRSADADAFLDEVDTAVRSWAATQLVHELDELSDAIGQGKGVAGPETLTFLSQGRIDRLYVVDDTFATGRPTSRFDFTLPSVLDEQSMSTTTQPTEAPTTEGAVALAVATGAEVVVVPSTGAGIDADVAGIGRGSLRT